MKKALVSPLQIKCDGYQIVDISESEFDVCIPFFWADCPDDTDANLHYYAGDKTIKRIDLQPCHIKTKAKALLTETDWTAMVEAEGVDQRLQNKSDFVFYRNILRNIAIDPKPVEDWPEKPNAKWESVA